MAVSVAASAEESNTVFAEGVAEIKGHDRDSARDAALEDAKRRAVEQAIGILVESPARVENHQLISSKILSQSGKYVKQYNITGENTDSGLLRVRTNAEVAFGQLIEDLADIGILLRPMRKPRTIVMISEQNVGTEVYAWWVPEHSEAGSGIADKIFTNKFSKKGFEIIDSLAASKKLKLTPAYRVQDLTIEQAKALGSQADAEVVIMGKVVATQYGEMGGEMKSAQADLSARAVRIDIGQVIASAAAHATATHTSKLVAGTEAIRKAADQATDEISGEVLAYYAKETGNTRSINITLTGLNKAQFAEFRDRLRDQVRGIKDLREQSFNKTTARLSVDTIINAQMLSEELLRMDFGNFSVEVISLTANSIELKVTLQQK
jgi:hypothetical protein